MVRRIALAVLAGTLMLALALPAGSSAVYPNPNPWRGFGFLNIAHQGGEDEAPSNTLFAHKSAVRDRGADMLELDVNLTEDGQLVVIHDDTVNRTTEETRTRDTGFSQVRDLTLAEVQALDAGFTFTNTGSYNKSQPPESYPYRGVRTGAKAPPTGYAADDFKIPTLREILNAFPTTPINIEIKMEKRQGSAGGGCVTSGPGGPYCDDPTASIPVAEALADVLTEPAYASRRDIIVVSFSDILVEEFHDDAPLVALAPALGDASTYILSGGNTPPDPDVAAFQVPPVSGIASGIPEALILAGAHEDGYAIHVWPNTAEGDTEPEYDRFLKLGVEGYMASEPLRLHKFLCAKEVPRPNGSDRCPPPKTNKCKKKRSNKPRAGLRSTPKKRGKCKRKKKKKGKK